MADTPELVESVRRLLRDYQAALGIDLEFQGFARELETLPGDYGPPDGLLLVSIESGTARGCIALRRWNATHAEMKRLFVLPAGRGRGLGRALVARAVEVAASLGYSDILLDTLPTMTEAQALYHSLGFIETPPYRDSPVPGTRFLVLRLAPSS